MLQEPKPELAVKLFINCSCAEAAGMVLGSGLETFREGRFNRGQTWVAKDRQRDDMSRLAARSTLIMGGRGCEVAMIGREGRV